MQQLLKLLLAGQEQMKTDIIAGREHMKQMMARTFDNMREMGEGIRSGRAKIRNLCGLVVRISWYRFRGPGFSSQRYQTF
jgi:Spy/CpxP family protein refolding chaperone